MNRLKDQVALITGGGSGLGHELSLALAREGVHIIVNYHTSEEKARETVKEIEGMGGKALTYEADISKTHEIFGMVDKVLEIFGKIDILINNAGIFFRTPLEELTEEKWSQILDTNLKSVLFISQAVSRGMLREKGGRIINIADVGGIRPWPGYIAYSISKAGVIMATKCLARALAPEIVVNCIAPGLINVPPEWSEEKREEMRKRIPTKRFSSHQDVVNAVLFLLCDVSYVTGQILVLDGGGS